MANEANAANVESVDVMISDLAEINRLAETNVAEMTGLAETEDSTIAVATARDLPATAVVMTKIPTVDAAQARIADPAMTKK